MAPPSGWESNCRREQTVLPSGLESHCRRSITGPKSSFQMRASFVFHLETNFLESGGRVEKLIAQVS